MREPTLARALDIGAGILLVLLPPLGLLLLARFPDRLRFSQRWRARRGYVHLGLGSLVLSSFSLAFGTRVSVEMVIASLALIVLPLIGCIPRRTVIGALAGFLMLVAMFGVERSALSRMWSNGSNFDLPALVSGLFGSEQVGSVGVWGAHNRYWSTEGATGPLTFEADVRLVSGSPGNSWFTFGPPVVIERPTGSEGLFNRISLPSTDSYVVQRFRLPEPVGGKTFRLTFRMRVDSVGGDTGVRGSCNGIMLRVQPAGYEAGCSNAPLSIEWTDYEFIWTPPDNSEATMIRAEMRIPSNWFDIHSVQVEQSVDGSWAPLGIPEPTGARFSLAVAGLSQTDWPSYHLMPTEEWRRHTWTLDPETSASTLTEDTARIALRVEEDTVIKVRDASLRDGTGRQLRPLIENARQQLWYPHPNLAGHSVVILTVGLLVLTAKLPLFAFISIAGGAVIFMSGSRAAWLALILSSFILAAITWKRGRWLLVTLALSIILLAGLGYLNFDSFGRLQIWESWNSGSVSRFEIWRQAWTMFTENPLTGLGDRTFSEAWLGTTGGASETSVIPSHAHNLWLHHASQSGMAGLLSVLWLSLGLTWLSWRSAGFRGLVFMGTVLLVNVFDYTFHNPSVFFSTLFFVVVLDDIARKDRFRIGAHQL